MSRTLAFAYPGDLRTPTGGYVYDRRVIAAWRAEGRCVQEIALSPRFPAPRPEDVAEAAMLLRQTRADAVIVDGLALGALPADVLAGSAAPLIGLIHHPLFLESGLAPQEAARLKALEGAALARCDAIVATSARTAQILTETFGVANVHVAEPGVDPASRAPGSPCGPVRLLAVGALSPRKNYAMLLAALGAVDGDWRLDIVGATDRAPPLAAALVAQAQALGLASRVRLTGALDDAATQRAFDSADLFVHPAVYEGYGMAVAEAIAHGLALVVSAEAAETGVTRGAGALIAPADAPVLWANRIQTLIDDRTLRATLAARSWRAAQTQPRWAETAAAVRDGVATARGNRR